MKYRVPSLSVLALAAALALAAPASGGARAPVSVQVAGAGPIAWTQVAARERPDRSARVLRVLTEFRKDFRPRYLLALSVRSDARTGKPSWYQVVLPGKPNGRTGWVPAAAVALAPIDRWLVIHRGARRFAFYVGGKLVRSGPVAIGAPGTETPLGLFYVLSKFVPTLPILGAYAFETSGHANVSDWPGGGIVGVHGTNTPELIGGAVSHGCVRLRNRDILFLRSVVPVGTPVRIAP